jgi:hypothetical protein
VTAWIFSDFLVANKKRRCYAAPIMNDSQKSTLALCAAFIAAPRIMFLDQDSAAALRAVLADSVWKAEILLEQVDARWPNRHATKNEAAVSAFAVSMNTARHDSV